MGTEGEEGGRNGWRGIGVERKKRKKKKALISATTTTKTSN